ncbi:hypothetical protein [Methanomethylovorans sp. PtaU1.Bin093]|uniref:hypothetical protein n=1 Tax=Methanomethylovorans sp. PtaU1.Bin093 TaxID=1811679 RepID=UPI0025D233D2|nr:hypothetical protein [Methanomethylovorans sp. PtaU1.Bin093]
MATSEEITPTFSIKVLLSFLNFWRLAPKSWNVGTCSTMFFAESSWKLLDTGINKKEPAI